MQLPASLRTLAPLLAGLALGAAAAILFRQSLPGEVGSPEERASQLEVELKRAQNRIAALEAETGGGRRPGRTTRDATRQIAENIREGKPVTPDDVFHAMQPLLRDLSPLFDRIRIREQKQRTETLTGELARKYDLNIHQQEALAKWFEAKAEENAKRWSDLVNQEGTRLEDLARASREIRADDGLDAFMPSLLSGEKLNDFRTERMAERAERVQQAADRKVARLDGIVQLDDAQREQVFGIAARSSPDFEPGMRLEAASGGEIPGGNTSNPQAAILGVLRPDQRAAYEAERERRRVEAAKDAAAVGLTLPADWNPLDDLDW